MRVEQLKSVYFIGIGGIGMSALARFFLLKGAIVCGYDRTETALTKELEAEGIDIGYLADASRISDQIDLVVYTPAIPSTNPELMEARKKGLPLLKRAQVLGLISRSYRTIAVAGTHGKTTTSTMIAHLLREGGISCNAFLGGISVNYNSNFLAGNADWLVVEADEYDRSFLEIHPDLAVITSVEADHLDIYGSENSVWETGFLAFAQHINPRGKLLLQEKLLPGFSDIKSDFTITSYGLYKGSAMASNLRVERGQFIFDYRDNAGTINNLSLSIPGQHNVENAVAAIAIVREVGVTDQLIRKGIATFKGIKRRFEKIWEDSEIVFYDDYAHHPTEINAVIQSLRTMFPEKKITGVFQPHLFSRTRDFSDDFARVLSKLDEVFLLPIYPAREDPIPGVSSALLLKKMTLENKKITSPENLIDEIKNNKPEILVTMGAGSIDEWVEPLKNVLANGK